jgi:hypothetical protein
MKDILHLIEVVLGKGTTDEVKFLVEFISRLVSHSSSQAGTELLHHSIIHVVYIEIAPQLKCQLKANTSAFEGRLTAKKTGKIASLLQTQQS